MISKGVLTSSTEVVIVCSAAGGGEGEGVGIEGVTVREEAAEP